MLDGSKDSKRRLKSMLFWDVNNGVSRRSWARNKEANFVLKETWKWSKSQGNFTKYCLR